jgi:hypothetical protein
MEMADALDSEHTANRQERDDLRRAVDEIQACLVNGRPSALNHALRLTTEALAKSQPQPKEAPREQV